MKKQILKWKDEHVEFLRLLDLLEQQISLFHVRATANYQLTLNIVFYLTHYADKFHHSRQDFALARLLDRDSSVQDQVRRIPGEHKVIASAGKQLLERLEAVLNGALLMRESVEVAAAIYVTYYRQHMVREEVGLFPMIDRVLRIKDWELVAAAIPQQDDPLFGKNVKAHYRALHRQVELAL